MQHNRAPLCCESVLPLGPLRSASDAAPTSTFEVSGVSNIQVPLMLSRWVVPLVWVPLITWGLACAEGQRRAVGGPLSQLLAGLVLGAALWQCLEYAVHRFVFHNEPTSAWGVTVCGDRTQPDHHVWPCCCRSTRAVHHAASCQFDDVRGRFPPLGHARTTRVVNIEMTCL